MNGTTGQMEAWHQHQLRCTQAFQEYKRLVAAFERNYDTKVHLARFRYITQDGVSLTSARRLTLAVTCREAREERQIAAESVASWYESVQARSARLYFRALR